MTNSWDWKKGDIVETYIDKTQNPKTGQAPPVVARGALYQSGPWDDNIYLYGGTTSYQNTSFPGWVPPSPSRYTLWSYNTKVQTWDQYDISSASPYRPSSGSYAEAPDLGLGFYLNGGIDSGSSTETESLGNDTKIWLQGMVVIDTRTRTARNVSTESLLLGGNPRSRGRMVYVPGVGKKGILVAIGGSYKAASDASNTVIGTMLSMRFVDVFDVASLDDGSNGTWYTQKTSGDIPDSRVEPCLIVASAPDNSSYNIYMYGGRSSQQTFDQMYVLSLPSFTWTKLSEGFQPRYGMTCHRVGNRQLLSVGGFQTYNLSSGCDWQDKGVHIYDMSKLTWGSAYDAKADAYTVPVQVARQIGGGPSGSATLTAPVDGFTTPPFAQLFGQTNTTQLSNSTKPSVSAKATQPQRVSKGVIAGSAVGGTAAFALTLGVLAFFIRRRDRRRLGTSTNEFPRYTGPAYEKDGSDLQPPVELEQMVVELPADRGIEIGGAQFVRKSDDWKTVPDI